MFLHSLILVCAAHVWMDVSHELEQGKHTNTTSSTKNTLPSSATVNSASVTVSPVDHRLHLRQKSFFFFLGILKGRDVYVKESLP